MEPNFVQYIIQLKELYVPQFNPVVTNMARIFS